MAIGLLGKINRGLNRIGPSDPRAQLAMASSLLQSGAPSTMPSSFMANLGGAMQLGHQVQDQLTAEQQRAMLIEQQMAAEQQRQALIAQQIAQYEQEQKARSSFQSAVSRLLQNSLPMNASQQSLLGAAAAVNPTATLSTMANIPGLLSRAAPKQQELSTTGKMLRDIETAIGRTLTEREVFTLSGAGELFEPDEAEDLDVMLDTTDLSRLRQPDGSPFAAGSTLRDAVEAGATVVSDAERQNAQRLESALGVLTELKRRQGEINESGIFAGVGSNILARLANGVGNGVGYLMGTEASESRSVFRDLSRGTIAPLVRALGESGALSDGDVDRALALLPKNGGLLPESTRMANEKLKELEELFSRAVMNLEMGSPADSQKTDLGNGVTMEWLD